MLLGAADLWEEARSAAVGQVLGLGGSSVSSFALTMESLHLCCWNSHSHWEVVYCFTERFRTQTLVFSDIFCLSEHTWLKLQCGVAVAFEITVSTLAVCVCFRCGSASPPVCKPWAVLGKGRLWKAELKQSRLSLLCELGLQMHALNVVLQSAWTACNYSIRESTETIKRPWEQYFPLWPWPRSRLTKVILCEMWALLNLIVSLSSINLHYSKEKSSVSNNRVPLIINTLKKVVSALLLLLFYCFLFLFCYSKD